MALPRGSAGQVKGAPGVTTRQPWRNIPLSVNGGLYSDGTTIQLAPIDDGDVLANISGSNGAPVGVPLSDLLDHDLASTEGSIIYRGATAWTSLGPGTSGNFLKTQGAAADPIWAAIPAGVSPANPTATASDTAVNGTATTYMRSDAAPAVQKCSVSQFGLAKPDGGTITSSGGVITATAGSGGSSFSPYFFGSLALPAASSFTLNKSTTAGTSTFGDLATRGTVLAVNGGTTATATAEQASLSSSSFTVTTFLYAWGPIAGGAPVAWAIFIKDSTGKYVAYGIRNPGGTAGTLEKFIYASLSGAITSTSLSGSMPFNQMPVWLRVQLTGGNFIFSFSLDGENFFTVLTEAQTVIGATISTVGIGGINTAGSTQFVYIDCFSFSNTSP